MNGAKPPSAVLISQVVAHLGEAAAGGNQVDRLAGGRRAHAQLDDVAVGRFGQGGDRADEQNDHQQDGEKPFHEKSLLSEILTNAVGAGQQFPPEHKKSGSESHFDKRTEKRSIRRPHVPLRSISHSIPPWLAAHKTKSEASRSSGLDVFARRMPSRFPSDMFCVALFPYGSGTAQVSHLFPF